MNTLSGSTCTVLAIVLAIVSLTGCDRSINIKIGVAMPMSGPLAQFGKDSTHGAQTAIDELNDEHFMIGGKRAHFEMVVEDDKSEPETGKQAARNLVDAKVSAVFGDYNSGVTIPASAIYAQAGIPQMTVSANSKYTRQGFKTAFRIVPDDVLQGMALAGIIADKLQAKSIHLVDDGTTYGAGITDEVAKVLKNRDLILPRDSVDAKTDLSALIEKIKNDKVDVIFYGGDEKSGIPLLKELRKNNNTIKFVAANSMCDKSIIAHANGAADNNFYCAISGVPLSWLSAGANFTRMYTAKYGAPGIFSPLAYDSVHVFAQAMQNAESGDPDTYLPFLAKGSFDGKIQGPVEFDEKGDLKDGTIVAYQIVGGNLIEDRNTKYSSGNRK